MLIITLADVRIFSLINVRSSNNDIVVKIYAILMISSLRFYEHKIDHSTLNYQIKNDGKKISSHL
jgi:hypothetical protein